MRLLEVSLVGCLYATSRWTLTTTLFKAIKRINLSRGSKLASTPQTKIWLFYALKDAGYIAWLLYAMFFSFFLLALLLFLSSFLWRSNSFKKVYELYDKDILLVIFSREFLYKFMTWRFHLLHFPLRFLLIFSFWFLRSSSLLLLSLWSIILGLSCFPFLGYLTPSCVHFLNYFKEGEETFCSLNVFFSWGMPGGANSYRGVVGNLGILGK